MKALYNFKKCATVMTVLRFHFIFVDQGSLPFLWIYDFMVLPIMIIAYKVVLPIVSL